jgi:hypothetical protein
MPRAQRVLAYLLKKQGIVVKVLGSLAALFMQRLNNLIL